MLSRALLNVDSRGASVIVVSTGTDTDRLDKGALTQNAEKLCNNCTFKSTIFRFQNKLFHCRMVSTDFPLYIS